MKPCPLCTAALADGAIVCRTCGASPGSQGWTPAGERAAVDPLAVASLVAGVLWLYGFGSIVAVVLGVGARRTIEGSGGRLRGTALATAGIVIGVAGLLATVLGALAFVAVLETLPF